MTMPWPRWRVKVIAVDSVLSEGLREHKPGALLSFVNDTLLAAKDLAESLTARHKSGVAVRFPRILRWREDKRVEEADSRRRDVD